MTAPEIRNSFLEFFRQKEHRIVPSAPMVVKNDPTLMFTNAGMNQFKDIFLGNSPIKDRRVANSQKCLRVSGKHNDLEEVGHDTYHHTMFEMLGNWSFGDYFKEEAITWAWEYLTEVLKIDKSKLYVTIFEGSVEEGIERDTEAYDIWKRFVAEDHIINGNKKDNFWEMGDQGPCGPCSEIHIDLRPQAEIDVIGGKELVNNDHPQVIEIWNNVFIQFNRKADGSLELLPSKHVDTGMGFERLVRVLQGKTSNYDTDIFQPIIRSIENITGIKYGTAEETDIAMRVIADHIRTISFAITDGQLPSNNKAGYVIRRILRRAVRYGYTFLNQKEAFIYKLGDALIASMGHAYPELTSQKDLVANVIREEEESFLRTLSTGIALLNKVIVETKKNSKTIVSGVTAFELFDTFGFPLDLTELILRENGLAINKPEFETAMNAQKERARNASSSEAGDWIVLEQDDKEEFIGYDYLEADVKITRYRKVVTKNREIYHLVFNITPFYAESGGQIGDTGVIQNGNETILISDTKKENNLIIHLTETCPKEPKAKFKAVVNGERRQQIANNHSATHLLHAALRQVVGAHVEQKGSLVQTDYLRFDFSHFSKLSDQELAQIELLVNAAIRKNSPLQEVREMPIAKAQELGAMALFGEKYGDVVRTIQFDNSFELCGGTHVSATGNIGVFKIISESSIAAGVRRIEACTAQNAEKYINEQFDTIKELQGMFKNPNNLTKNVESLIHEKNELAKQVEGLLKDFIKLEKQAISAQIETVGTHKFVKATLKPQLASMLKDIAFQLKSENPGLVAVLGTEDKGRAQVCVAVADDLVQSKTINAVEIIKAIAADIDGSGGGQPMYATAGGKNPQGIDKALANASKLIKEKL